MIFFWTLAYSEVFELIDRWHCTIKRFESEIRVDKLENMMLLVLYTINTTFSINICVYV